MGYDYEVIKFVYLDGQYQDVFAYQGQSLLKAICAMVKARKDSKCVSFIWRG